MEEGVVTESSGSENVIYAEFDNATPLSVRHLIPELPVSPSNRSRSDVSPKAVEEIKRTHSDPGESENWLPERPCRVTWNHERGILRATTDIDAVEYMNLEGVVKDSDHLNFEPMGVPTLVECMAEFSNPETVRLKNLYQTVFFKDYFGNIMHDGANVFYDTVAAFYIYVLATLNLEAVLVVSNAAFVTNYFAAYSSLYACKLDFSILAFSVVFPLSFLIQQAFTRREQAMVNMSDFRGILLQCVIATMVWDWPTADKPHGGRLSMPSGFNAMVRNDCKELLQTLYTYLSMPTVTHARHRVFPAKRKQTRAVHALQNDLVKRMNECLFNFNDHSEMLKARGFPAGEASRLHQYHWYLQSKFEQLRFLKYYRTPQATRSFGRVYVLVLPWIIGPYFSWVVEATGSPFGISLAAFSFLVLLGLLNTQKYLEDPFVEENNGLDHVKLKYELSSALQSVEQHFVRAEMRRLGASTKEVTEDFPVRKLGSFGVPSKIS